MITITFCSALSHVREMFMYPDLEFRGDVQDETINEQISCTDVVITV